MNLATGVRQMFNIHSIEVKLANTELKPGRPGTALTIRTKQLCLVLSKISLSETWKFVRSQ